MATPRKWVYPLTALVLGLQAGQAIPALAQSEIDSQTEELTEVSTNTTAAPASIDPAAALSLALDSPADPKFQGEAAPLGTAAPIEAATGSTTEPLVTSEVLVPGLNPIAPDSGSAPLLAQTGDSAADATASAATSSGVLDAAGTGTAIDLDSAPRAGSLTLPTFDLTEAFALDPNAPEVPVEQLRNIEAEHWAAQAVKQLGDRYECYTTGDPFATKAVITRYEFAAYMEPCLEQLNDLIESETADRPNREDIAAIQRLQEEFSAELATLKGRIDGVEERLDTLEANRFSDRTKLFGVGSFLLSAAYGNAGKGYEPRYQSTVILDFDTRFTGTDLFRAEIRASNMNFIRSADVVGTGMSLLNVVPETDSQYLHVTGGGEPPSDQPDFEMSALFYQIRFAERGLLRFGTHGITSDSLIPDMSIIPSASLYGVRSPIYRNSVGGGAVVFYQFNDLVSWGASYLVKNPDFTSSKDLFNGRFGALTQVTLTPTPKLGIALTYGRHNSDGRPIWAGTGSENTSFPFGYLLPASDRNFPAGTGINRIGANVNDFGLGVRYQATKQITVGGWFGYSMATAVDNAQFAGGANEGDDARIMYWAAGMKVQDLGRRGNQLGFLVGMPPKVIDNDYTAGEDTSTSYHFELTYRHRINNRVYLQPGFYFVTSPGHVAGAETLFVPTLNTLFIF